MAAGLCDSECAVDQNDVFSTGVVGRLGWSKLQVAQQVLVVADSLSVSNLIIVHSSTGPFIHIQMK